MAVVSRSNESIALSIILLLSVCLSVCNAAVKTRPTVTILQGTVQGVNLSTRNNRTISGFLGIPFAEPPIGDLRFAPPVPANIWSGTWDAGSDTPDCAQISLDSQHVVLGSEDCLYINVYSPRLPSMYSDPLPVMVYIHGGAWISGSNNSTLYGPGYLLDEDIVLVVPSYRLGPLGFLSTGDEESLGNWGLKDQILALEWVRDNIEYFGGDPDQVTIVGSSVGSMSVNFLALTNLTDGLFHRYISQSGSALSHYAYHPSETSKALAFQLGEYLGCLDETSALLVECLRNINVTDIVILSPELLEWEIFPLFTWAPTIEPDVEGAVLTDTPANLIASGKLDDFSAMIGAIELDGVIFSGPFWSYPNKFEEFLSDFDYQLPYVLGYWDKVEDVAAYTSALKSYFFNTNFLTGDRKLLLENLTQLGTDYFADYPNHEILKRVSKNNITYLYSFDYRGTYTYGYQYAFGATQFIDPIHSDELMYLFPQPAAMFGTPNGTMSDADMKIVAGMVELWTTFITTGKPVRSAVDFNGPWNPYSTATRNYLKIGTRTDITIKIEYSEATARMEFLENLDATIV